MTFSFCFLVLPGTKWTKSPDVDRFVNGIIYATHFVLILLHHASHWRVFLSDPGYFDTAYHAERIEIQSDQEDIENGREDGPADGAGGRESPDQVKYEIYSASTWRQHEKEQKEKRSQDTEGST